MQATIYVYLIVYKPPVELNKQEPLFIKLKFIILEQNWPFPNFEMLIQSDDPILFISKEIVNRHGGITDIKLYLDFDKQNELDTKKFAKPMGEILNVKGSPDKANAPTITIFYNFRIAVNNPLQLY